MNNFAKKLIILILILTPLVSLALGALAWLRYGIDMPWFDDWRGYTEGNIHSLGLNYLFRPVNDTLVPIGFALDALAQRYLNGNSIAYQLLSMMVVLGGILVLQWRLLLFTLGSKISAASCFIFTLLMLQPGSYWGLENMAYHQALPLLFILSAILIMLGGEEKKAWHGLIVFGFGLLAAFSYISGAFGVFSVAFVIFVLGKYFFSGEYLRRLMFNAAWFLLAGAIGMVIQVWFAVLSKRGQNVGIPLAYPYEADFWFFYLGKMARSLLLSQSGGVISLIAVIFVCILAIFIAFLALKYVLAKQDNFRSRQVVMVYVALLSAIFIYMSLIAAGRTNFRLPGMVAPLEIFAHGFTRFHFFWATILWPWLVAVIIVLMREKKWIWRFKIQWIGVVLIAVFIFLMCKGGAFSHMNSHKEIAASRNSATLCLHEALQRGGEIRCPGLLPPQFSDMAPDAMPAYVYAWKSGASFVRNFPVLSDVEGLSGSPLMRRFGVDLGELKLNDLVVVSPGFFRVVGSNPEIHFDLSEKQAFGKCLILDFSIDMIFRADSGDGINISYIPMNKNSFSEKNVASQKIFINKNGRQIFNLRLESSVGFRGEFKINPDLRQKDFEIREVRANCRIG